MISFVIPVFNKGKVLFPTLQQLVSTLKNSSFSDYEIVIVIDGSTDNSFAEALRFKKFDGENSKIKIYHYHENIGKGFALRFGFYKSVGQTICFLDGDMDIGIVDIMTALKQFTQKTPDMVIGSKYHPRSRYHYPTNRIIYSKVLRVIIQLLFRLSVSDTQVGMKIFKREVLTAILPKLIVKRFATDLELLMVAFMFGYTNIIESPVTIDSPKVHTSSINAWAAKDFCQDILAIFYRRYILQFYSDNKSKSDLPLSSIDFQSA